VSGKGHALGRKIGLIEGQLLDDVRYAILHDGQYVRPDRRRLLLANEDAPPLPPRQAVSEERSYDIVTLKERSRHVISLLEAARVRFYISRFRQDYEAGRVERTWRPLYEQTAGFVPQYDSDGNAYVVIRSRFFRAINRRFHAADFWPEHVPDKLRERWFGAVEDINARGLVVDEETDQLVEVGRDYPNQFVDRDITSSQTQIVSVFLNEPDLEALACDPKKPFKRWLAEQLWALDEREQVLAPGGYKSANDEYLVAFIKELWMRRNCGGKFGQTVRDLARPENRSTYGPGWNADVFRAGGVKQAEHYWRRFLASLPEWERRISRFLEACQYLGREADWDHGIRFDDPLDGAEIQWNPIRRAMDRVPTGKRHIEVLRPGITTRRRDAEGRVKRKFFWRDPYVDAAKLGNRVAPCVVHALDAYFNALVLEGLHAEGETNVIAVHDSWFVPEIHPEIHLDRHRDQFTSGAELVEYCIEQAGKEWLEGIGSVYGWFMDATRGTPYRRFARELRRAWCKRVTERRWPKFTAS
jgi:hypothetical protein